MGPPDRADGSLQTQPSVAAVARGVLTPFLSLPAA